jgi:DNA (cytosine-5)-methyltransferase 1
VLRWLDETRPAFCGIENVPAFQKWGPLGRNNRPVQSRKGETFRAYIEAIRSRGYTVEYRVCNSADFGAATARPRLYIMARFDGARSRGPIVWPRPTHAQAGTMPLFADVLPWRGAKEIIDWRERSQSIFGRKKPLAENTLRRIAAGARKFWGVELEPFLVAMEHGGRELDINKPLPVITTAKGGAFGVVEPFLLGQHGGSVARPVSQPSMTIATDGAISLLEPFLVAFYGSGVNVESIREPLRTVTTKDRFGLVQPARLDIGFRMLRPHELSAAMGFPEGYRFAGTRTDAVKQIGNAVEVNQAAALWRHPVESLIGLRRVA